MPLFRKLATLATAAEAARRYAKSNPDKAGRFLDQAAAFVDKQTKGKYHAQIDGVARRAKGAAGIPTPPGPAAGYPQDNGQAPGYRTPETPQPGKPSPGARPAP